ncbi:MAG: hypothetical protein DCC75_00195 [Proteobacteria bacterium]|nr:MAG: hypothetical protein DCC75_00195 [Pseudomonadota bacterium]
MRILKAIILSIGALLPLSAFLTDLKAESAPYKIGVILPLSGEVASLGNYIKRAIDLAYSELPEDQQSRLKLIYEDDQLQSQKSVSIFHKLNSLDKADAVFVLGSGVGNAVGPLAERQGKILIAIGASDKKFAVGTKHVFIHWVVPEKESEIIVREIKKRGLQRIAIIAAEQEGVIAFNKAFMAEMAKHNLTDRIVLDERYLQDNKDFKPFLSKVRAKQADSIYVLLFPGGLSTFMKQARDFAIKADIFGAELFEDQHEVAASDGTLIGKWYVNADEASPDFIANYKKKYGEHPGWATANAYDSLKLMADAVARHGNDNAAIASYLRGIKDYKGAAGSYSATGDNRFDLPATIKIVTKDGFEKISG